MQTLSRKKTSVLIGTILILSTIVNAQEYNFGKAGTSFVNAKIGLSTFFSTNLDYAMAYPVPSVALSYDCGIAKAGTGLFTLGIQGELLPYYGAELMSDLALRFAYRFNVVKNQKWDMYAGLQGGWTCYAVDYTTNNKYTYHGGDVGCYFGATKFFNKHIGINMEASYRYDIVGQLNFLNFSAGLVVKF